MKKIISFFASEKRQTWLVYAWMLVICFLSYGVLIPALGFYWDDFPILFLYKTFGASGFPEFLASDRPFSAWNFMLTTSLFKFNPLGYHLLAFALRYLSVILFYWIFRTVWPERRKIAAVAAGIFAIYPGFHQQPIALIYCHHFSVFDLFLLSVLLMLQNAKREKFNWPLAIVSYVGALGMFSIENFATLEMLRPLLLWILLKPKFKDFKALIKAILKLWLPYLLIFGAFMFWRVFIFKFPTYEPDLLEGYQSSPTSILVTLFSRIPKDFFTVTVKAWLDSFRIPKVSDFGTSATYLFWALSAAGALLSALFLSLLGNDKPVEKATQKKPLWEWLVVGLFLYCLAGSIVWVLDMPLEIEFAWDRMTLAFIPGVAVIAALIYALVDKSHFAANLLVCLLIGSAVGAHFENEMSYKRDWEDMQNLFWQMSWRMPDLEPGTVVLGSDIGVDYYSDNSLTAPLNLMYAPDSRSYDLNYVFYYSDVRLGSWLSALEPGVAIHQPYRSFDFNGSTDRVVAVKYDPPACLQVMDRTYANSIALPNLSETQVSELKLTDLSLIKSEPAHQPLTDIFTNQPQKDWCYYFETADLARQNGDYDQAVALGEEAIAQGYAPRAASEWLPFLESNIRLENWERTEYIADQLLSAEGNYENGLCNTLKRLSRQDDVPSADKLVEYMQEYNCP
ncbi:hypothetical protein [Pelolinea submarina]|uniref:Glycosyltransferase RgtA/B/C/D-like domain-containing protein n=1 Tax=Pelolinea submarina TaxID=913107 RepID=A0A347ZSI9_9CHLR|nr:hypothetical protein [Pelolinea submarina]REG11163.1 hypothetical protein DFR64_1040 [Pelolinea submarina]BBB48270.1 hypothetical protein Pelsub_P1498 [Pelolinea submarina]